MQITPLFNSGKSMSYFAPDVAVIVAARNVNLFEMPTGDVIRMSA